MEVIRGGRCGLKSIEFLFTGRIGHADFVECIQYLSGKDYINFWDCGGKTTEFAEKDFRFTEISLSDAGIQVLRGAISDELVEV